MRLFQRESFQQTLKQHSEYRVEFIEGYLFSLNTARGAWQRIGPHCKIAHDFPGGARRQSKVRDMRTPPQGKACDGIMRQCGPWKPLKCPSTEEWIKKMWYMYTMEYYSAVKKNEIMPFAATWMDLEMIVLSEVSQKEKDRYHMILLMIQTNLFTKQKQTHRLREQTYGYLGEGWEVRDRLGVWD